ncbi:ABC transporter permease [Shivajiella indica]|uniref:ABC transporter permease n=1 Tax=Shivajiella indica TaxID=872115 RepID=A0ABW5B615_9BACT
MWKNYLKVAFRNLIRHRTFSFINIFGLAISMSLSLIVIMLVMDQYKFDRHNSKKDRIFRINTLPNNWKATASTTLAVRNVLLEDYTGIEKAVRIKRGFGNRSMVDFEKDINIPVTGFYTDPEFLEIFELELESGNPATALIDPYSVVLTKEAAEKIFTTPNPIGEVIKVGDQGDYKVTGVLKDQPDQKSHIIFDGLASISTLSSKAASDSSYKSSLDSWENIYDGYVYILLEEGLSPQQIQKSLNEIAFAQYGQSEPQTNSFALQSLTKITPGPDLNNPIGPILPKIVVIFLGGLAIIVMLTSCFNFTNLSIARSLTRAKEIGVRKVTGAKRIQIFTQFLTEAVVIALLALIFSWMIVILIKPFLLNLKLVQVLRWDFSTSLEVYPYLIGFAILVGILAGFFPAVILSSFQPIKVLKNLVGVKLFSALGLRKSLLVLQFSISLIFILSAILVFNQTKFFLTKDVGFAVDDKMLVRLNNTSYELLKSELLHYSNVESVSGISHIPGSGITFGEDFRTTAEAEKLNIDYFQVDEDYLDNMGLELIAGNNFNSQLPESNKSKVIINQLAVEKLGFETAGAALGNIIFEGDGLNAYEIIGVVHNYNHRNLLMDDAPMALMYNPEGFSQLQVKYNGSEDQIIATLQTAWNKINPDLKMDYGFFDFEMREMYQVFFGLLTKVVGVVAFLAIMISCLGLLGMATYIAETKIKEVAIRKILGATASGITLQLSMGFIKIVLIAIVVGLPAAWFLNNLWLQTLANRVNMGLGTISLAIALILVLSVLTVGSQAVRAAFSNPADNLKND